MKRIGIRCAAALLAMLMMILPLFAASAEPVEAPVAEVGAFQLGEGTEAPTHQTVTTTEAEGPLVEAEKEVQTEDSEGDTPEDVFAGWEEEAESFSADNASVQSLFKSSYTIGVGQSLELPAPVDGTQYKSSAPKIASVGLDSGIVKGIKKGTATLAAKVPGYGIETFKVTVVAAPTRITLKTTRLELKAGQTARITGSITPSNCMTALSFRSSNPSVAEVDASGVVTAMGSGTATITVSTHNGKTAKCSVTVKSNGTVNAPVYRDEDLSEDEDTDVFDDVSAGLVLDRTELNLNVKGSATLKWRFEPSSMSTQVAFKSSKTSVATVSSKGVVKAKKAGRAVITVKAKNGLTATCAVTVWKAPTKVAISSKTATLTVGETLTLSSAVPSGANPEVTWSTSDQRVATVAEGVVTAVGAGSAVITVKTVNGKKAQCKVTVEPSTRDEWEDEDDEPVSGDEKYIIDISKYDGNIDFDRLAPHVSLVIARASCGTQMDTKFESYAAAMNARGIPFGVYCYTKAATTGEARTEARAFYQYAKGSNAKFYVVDAEYSTNTQETIEAFCQELRALGAKKVGCYIAHNYYKTFGFSEIRDQFDFVWIPRYGKNDGTLENSTQPSYACDLWQYTSEGSVPGISGDVDMNVLTGQGKSLSYFTR